MSQPWYTYNRIDSFGTIDPQSKPGHQFWKPDSNVQAPGGAAITALLSGTVTDVHNDPSQTQTVVTVKLDSPQNSLATHTFYEHLSSSTVQVGQHINIGDLLGYNNPTGSVPVGFGFYSGDVYGSGSAWTALQNDLKPGGAGLLNPVNFLNSVKTGGAGTSTQPSSSQSWEQQIGSGFLAALGLPSPQQVQNTFEQVVIGFAGLMLILVGILILFFGNSSTRQVAEDGAMAAA